MQILILILLIVILLLIFYLLLLKKEVRNIRNQIELIQSLDTNKTLLSDFSDKDMVELINILNHFIQLKKTLELQTLRQNKSLRDMILNMSHDLRTPLTSIRGYMQMLSLDELSEDKKQQYIAIINEKILVLNDLLNNFFELSKVESEDYAIALELVDLQPVLAEVLAAYYPDFSSKEIDLEVSLDANLVMLGNANALKRICQNLLDNILKHDGKKAAVRCYNKEDKLLLEFSDVAPDFDEARLPKLFDKFYTFSTSEQNKNTGLGLAIVKELVQKMGGRIQAEYANETLQIIMSFNKC